MDSGIQIALYPLPNEPIYPLIWKMGDNVECDVVGVDDVRITLHDSITSTLTRAMHVLKLKKNLISLNALDLVVCQEGVVMKFVQVASMI